MIKIMNDINNIKITGDNQSPKSSKTLLPNPFNITPKPSKISSPNPSNIIPNNLPTLRSDTVIKSMNPQNNTNLNLDNKSQQ